MKKKEGEQRTREEKREQPEDQKLSGSHLLRAPNWFFSAVNWEAASAACCDDLAALAQPSITQKKEEEEAQRLRGRSLCYLSDDGQLLGHHGLELGGAHAGTVGSLVELRDQLVDGQLQL